jgi:hypothetical protein
MPPTRVTTENNLRSITSHLHEFDPNLYDWEECKVLFDTYLEVEGVNEDMLVTFKNYIFSSFFEINFRQGKNSPLCAEFDTLSIDTLGKKMMCVFYGESEAFFQKPLFLT